MTFINSGFGNFVNNMSRFLSFFIIGFALSACETKEVKLQQLLLKGNIAIEATQFEQAIYYYKEALKLDSCFSDAWNNLGTIDFRLGQQDEAIQHYDRAIQCNPKAEFYLNRANAQFENMAFFSALKDIEFFEKQKPDSIPAMVLKGLILGRLQQFDAAEKLFTEILELDSLNPDHWINRATINYYQKSFEKARPDLIKALEIDSVNSQAYNTLSMINADEGLFKNAMELVEMALKYSPDHPHYLNNRGYIRLLTGDLSNGEQDLNESMVREPDNPWVYRNKGILYLKLNKPESAEKLFRQVLAMDSSVDKTGEYLGLALLASGKKQDGCNWLKKSGASIPFSSNRCQ